MFLKTFLLFMLELASRLVRKIYISIHSLQKMASSSDTSSLYYRYEIIKKVWTAYLRRHHYGKSSIAAEYFSNFIRRHRSFQFSIMKIFDGTRHVVFGREQYETIRRELETKTGVTSFPDINAYDTNDSRNELEKRQKYYTTQGQFNEEVEEFESENSKIHQRVRQDAAEHKSQVYKFLTQKKDAKFLCFDLEVHDQDRKTMLEIGYVKFTLKGSEEPEYFHAIVNEELHNREGFDNKEKFKFGTSVRMPLEEAAEQLKEAAAGADALVTHSGYNDRQYLSENGIDIGEKPMFDTQKLALILLYGNFKWWGLKKILEETGISYDESILHNAGNDAHYTMLAFKALVKRAMPTTRF